MKSKIDSGRMMNRAAALQEENESLHTQIGILKMDSAKFRIEKKKLEEQVNVLLQNNDKLRKKIAMQEKSLAILKRVCGNDAVSRLKRDDEFCKDL